MDEATRTAFEVWASGEGFSLMLAQDNSRYLEDSTQYACEAWRAANKQMQQGEPVAWMATSEHGTKCPTIWRENADDFANKTNGTVEPLYAAPLNQKTQAPDQSMDLSDEDLRNIAREYKGNDQRRLADHWDLTTKFVRDCIEASKGIKP